MLISAACIRSGAKYGIDVERHRAVSYKDMHHVHEQYDLRLRYGPVPGCTTDLDRMTMPQTRIANGTTHYLLYKWVVANDAAIHILEHDAFFVGPPPESIYDGVIQTSSHAPLQMTAGRLWDTCRARKQRIHEPRREYDRTWDIQCGVIPHPLAGTNGTSGYIIGPGAAKKMIDYIESGGIANADRLLTEHLGEGNVYLQVPQSVFCTHAVKSHNLKMW